VSRLVEWREACAQVNRAVFAAQYTYAFLISAGDRATGEFVAPTSATKPLEFHTSVHGKALAAPAAQRGAEEPLVLPLRKAANNPFPERISVGRAVNCDVVIRDSSVSKLHGHFRDIGADCAVFTDAKSSNGTRVDGQAAAPGVPVDLRRHSLVVFGRVRLQLFSAADLYDWLAV
jgi:hypothetical protein